MSGGFGGGSEAISGGFLWRRARRGPGVISAGVAAGVAKLEAAGNPAKVVGEEADAGVPTPTSELGIADGLPPATAAGVAPDGENAYSGGSVGDRLANLLFSSDSTPFTALADGAKITR
jgi:hypothetical protein